MAFRLQFRRAAYRDAGLHPSRCHRSATKYMRQLIPSREPNTPHCSRSRRDGPVVKSGDLVVFSIACQSQRASRGQRAPL